MKYLTYFNNLIYLYRDSTTSLHDDSTVCIYAGLLQLINQELTHLHSLNYTLIKIAPSKYNLICMDNGKSYNDYEIGGLE